MDLAVNSWSWSQVNDPGSELWHRWLGLLKPLSVSIKFNKHCSQVTEFKLSKYDSCSTGDSTKGSRFGTGRNLQTMQGQDNFAKAKLQNWSWQQWKGTWLKNYHKLNCQHANNVLILNFLENGSKDSLMIHSLVLTPPSSLITLVINLIICTDDWVHCVCVQCQKWENGVWEDFTLLNVIFLIKIPPWSILLYWHHLAHW